MAQRAGWAFLSPRNRVHSDSKRSKSSGGVSIATSTIAFGNPPLQGAFCEANFKRREKFPPAISISQRWNPMAGRMLTLRTRHRARGASRRPRPGHAALGSCRSSAPGHSSSTPVIATLLKCGVRIFEYQRTLLHQKVMMVDGIWCCVGSTNFDGRSLELDDEITVGFIDADLTTKLRAAFEADKKNADELTIDEWRRRSGPHRALDRLTFMARREL